MCVLKWFFVSLSLFVSLCLSNADGTQAAETGPADAIAGVSATASSTHCQENIVFPADSGIVDVTASPYFAKGDGKTDDTKAIQTAIRDHMKGAILYFPNGVYLISSTLKWSKQNSKGEDCWGNFTIQGQSAAGAILRLKDGTFTDPKSPKAIMWCGGFGSADWFHNYVKNVTFDVGKNNPGAVGLQFYSNNTGSVRDVRIVSQDGQGAIGLDLAHRDMNGPLLVKNLKVHGFAVGVKTGCSVNSQTLEHIRLEGQSECGLDNDGQSLSIRKLATSGAAMAVRNRGGNGLLTLIDSTFVGSGSASVKAAIENEGPLFLRNVATQGFQRVLHSSRGDAKDAATIDEFVSEPVQCLFPSSKQSLGLAIKETPDVPWDPAEQWVSVKRFHKGGDDISEAAQAAIDSGATTVYFPRGSYKIGKTVIVRGNVRRLTGLNSWFGESAAGADETSPRFRVEGGKAPVVVLENCSGGFGGRPFVEYASGQTLVVRDSDGIPCRFHGTGEVFLEDTTGSPHGGVFAFAGKQRVWARQFNIECFINEKITATVENRGSDLWILGLKTEQGNRLVATRDGGRTEILGGLVYTVNSHEGRPAFLVDGGAMSLTILERCFMGTPMDPVVREIRGGETKNLGKTSVIGLFVGKAP